MKKEDLLLKNYSLLSKNPAKNIDALKSAIEQLMEINPKIGLKCWEECIYTNIKEIQADFGNEEFDDDNIGYYLINDFESDFCIESYFKDALDIYANNRRLLEIIYTKSPIYEYTGCYSAISYLIRNNRLKEAGNILSAIYKNKCFNNYSKLWRDIIFNFPSGEDYDRYTCSDVDKQPDYICDFCMSWIERIEDEEEQAGAMTFAMKMF